LTNQAGVRQRAQTAAIDFIACTHCGEARGGRRLEMTKWRIADLSFQPFDESGSSSRQLERATIDDVEIFREGGRYWINSAKGQLSNASEQAANAHLSWLYGEVGDG
jgi:hypothetical protein